MIPRLRTRPPSTRATRFDPRQRRLESLAGEFALLTQRRARTMHQLDLLDQQRAAAADTLRKVQVRLAWLLQHIDDVDPELRDAPDAAPGDPAGSDGRRGGGEMFASPRPPAAAGSGWSGPAHTMQSGAMQSGASPRSVPRPALGKPAPARPLAGPGAAYASGLKSASPSGRGWAGRK